MEQEINVIKHLVALRNCSKQSLPMGDSLIAYDLILYIATTYNKQSITPKQLFSSLPHSYSALRYHYNRLLEDGYVVHKPAESDKRVKYIEPTEKFISTVASYANQARVILDAPPPSAFRRVFNLVAPEVSGSELAKQLKQVCYAVSTTLNH